MTHTSSSNVPAAYASTSSVLFLDFDGVLHPVDCPDSQVLQHADALADVLDRHPQWSVVLSTSWRTQFTAQRLLELIPARLASRVISVTPDLSKDPVPKTREDEIQEWMRANRGWGTPMLALDDYPQNFPSQPSWLILCNPKTGLTPAVLASVDAWMAKFSD